MILGVQEIRMMGFLTQAPKLEPGANEGLTVTLTVRPAKPGPVKLMEARSSDPRITRFARLMIDGEAVVVTASPTGEILHLETWLPQAVLDRKAA